MWNKYEKLIRKIEQKEKLSSDESLDIAFIPKFISKEHGKYVTKTLAKIFKHAKTNENIFKRDVGVILGAMILKYFDTKEEINELMEDIDMEQIEDEIKIIARLEYAEEFEEIEEKLRTAELEKGKLEEKLNKQNKKALKLSKMSNLNTPEAKKLINSLIIN